MHVIIKKTVGGRRKRGWSGFPGGSSPAGLALTARRGKHTRATHTQDLRADRGGGTKGPPPLWGHRFCVWRACAFLCEPRAPDLQAMSPQENRSAPFSGGFRRPFVRGKPLRGPLFGGLRRLFVCVLGVFRILRCQHLLNKLACLIHFIILERQHLLCLFCIL